MSCRTVKTAERGPETAAPGKPALPRGGWHALPTRTNQPRRGALRYRVRGRQSHRDTNGFARFLPSIACATIVFDGLIVHGPKKFVHLLLDLFQSANDVGDDGIIFHFGLNTVENGVALVEDPGVFLDNRPCSLPCVAFGSDATGAVLAVRAAVPTALAGRLYSGKKSHD